MNTGCFKGKDYTNEKIGICIAVSKTKNKSKDGSSIWKLKCQCGKIFECSSSRFRQRKWSVYSCGCKRRFNAGQHVPKDLSGYRNHMATAIGPTEKRCKYTKHVIWKLKCDCGNVFERSGRMLIRGYTKSCGCKSWILGRKRKYSDSTAHIKGLYSHYKYAAKTRKIEFHLTQQECAKFFEGNCYYCNAVPIEKKVSPQLHGTYSYNGIDRLDSNLNYTIDNCVSCCGKCNFAKGTMNFQEFKNWIQNVFNHLNMAS